VEFLKEFIKFLKQRKKFWIIPIVIVLLIFGLLLLAVQNTVVAPFIYTLF
jgi:competence protein ComGC